jgi:hypothetical protein
MKASQGRPWQQFVNVSSNLSNTAQTFRRLTGKVGRLIVVFDL